MGRKAGRQRKLQGDYHRRLFHALHDWDRSWEGMLDVAGDAAGARALGFDQLGHFGAQGCALVAAAVAAGVEPGTAVSLAELGCGFGGALREIVAGLRARGVTTGRCVGVDFVAEHVRLFSTIENAADTRTAQPVQADVRALPLSDGCLDAVVCTGSLPHFAEVETVFCEAFRVLRPGGLLVMTEETSLRVSGRDLSDDFLRCHPPDIFFLTDAEERVAQLVRSGFTDIVVRDLTEWADALLGDRLKAMRLFFGDVAEIFGTDETKTLLDTLAAAREEYRRGTVKPAVVTARRP
ncbi:hypothetical protein AAW14_21825 [Streptomyces hygroscopicus]|uniref:class I SAM-dependent methyltransferase n=1 Tax=Streptomyces hygroscopicus TaxID=1912 RepID=UPI00223E9E2B|nr:class I SAM-dependent methyltransferase [Streptomyces hygroscopicus]MCW7944577.1 hypothetical protein [Streptomyces hygroscopicus]